MKRASVTGASLASMALIGLATASPALAQDAPGKAVYTASCAMCHDNGELMNAPTLAKLKEMSVASIKAALVDGKMAPMASSLSPKDIDNVSTWLGKK